MDVDTTSPDRPHSKKPNRLIKDETPWVMAPFHKSKIFSRGWSLGRMEKIYVSKSSHAILSVSALNKPRCHVQYFLQTIFCNKIAMTPNGFIANRSPFFGGWNWRVRCGYIPNENDGFQLGRTITKQKSHLFLDHQYRRMKFINEYEQGIIDV